MKLVPDGEGGFITKSEGLEEELEMRAPELHSKFQTLKRFCAGISTYIEFLGHLPLHGKSDYKGTKEDSQKEWKEYIKTIKYEQPGIDEVITFLKPDENLDGKLAYVIQADAPFTNSTKLRPETEPELGTSCGAVGIVKTHEFYKEKNIWYASFTLGDARELTRDEIWKYASAFFTWVWLRQPRDEYWGKNFEDNLKQSLPEKGKLIVIRDVLPCIKWGILK